MDTVGNCNFITPCYFFEKKIKFGVLTQNMLVIHICQIITYQLQDKFFSLNAINAKVLNNIQ